MHSEDTLPRAVLYATGKPPAAADQSPGTWARRAQELRPNILRGQPINAMQLAKAQIFATISLASAFPCDRDVIETQERVVEFSDVGAGG